MSWLEITYQVFQHEDTKEIHDCNVDDCGFICYDGDVLFCEISGNIKNVDQRSTTLYVEDNEKRCISKVFKKQKTDEQHPIVLLHRYFEKIVLFVETDETKKKETIVNRLLKRNTSINKSELKHMIDNERSYLFTQEEKEFWVNTVIQIYNSQTNNVISLQHLMIGVFLYAASEQGLIKNNRLIICNNKKLTARIPLEYELTKHFGIRTNTLTQIRKTTKVRVEWGNICQLPIQFH